MKICSLCGSTYGDRVDFCFKDGTPLLPVEAADEAAAAPERTELDAPDPAGLEGLAPSGGPAGERVDKAHRWSRPFAAPDPDDEEITAAIPRSALERALAGQDPEEHTATSIPALGLPGGAPKLAATDTLIPDRFPEMVELTSPRVVPPPAERRDLRRAYREAVGAGADAGPPPIPGTAAPTASR